MASVFERTLNSENVFKIAIIYFRVPINPPVLFIIKEN
jgi:hypothetical protein